MPPKLTELKARMTTIVRGKLHDTWLHTTGHNWRIDENSKGRPPYVTCFECDRLVPILHTLRFVGEHTFVNENGKINRAGMLDSSFTCHSCRPAAPFEFPTRLMGSRHKVAMRIRHLYLDDGSERQLLLQYQAEEGKPLVYGWFSPTMAGFRQMDQTLFDAQDGKEGEIRIRLQPKVTRTKNNKGESYNDMHPSDINIPSKLSPAKGFP